MGVREFKGRLLTTWKGAGQTERLVALLLVVFLLRLVAAIAAPLIDQETYHWAYAMHPDLSYFDHPPWSPGRSRRASACSGSIRWESVCSRCCSR